MGTENEVNYKEAKIYADKYLALFAPLCHKAEIAGSVRRMKQEMIHDIELVLLPAGKNLPAIWEIINRWKKTKGATGAKYTQRITDDGVTLDIFFASPDNWGYILAIRTGSAEFSHRLAKQWKKKGYEGREGFLYDIEKKKTVPLQSEEALFTLLGIRYYEPTERER